MRYSKLVIATLAVICLAGLTPKAQAQLVEEKIRVTFSAPVELPGHVLPAGSYIFEAIDSRQFTRVFSSDGKTVYGTFLTIPEERSEPIEKPMVVLGENKSDGAEQVDAWFYPGDTIGSEFRYLTPSSHHKIGAALGDTGRTFDTAMMDIAKGAATSSEFVGKHVERAVVDTGAAIGHAVKHLAV